MNLKKFQNQKAINTMNNPEVMAKDSTSGITLIALVVTIIVLIILAGISINLILGENGIIQKATQAKEQTIISKEREQVEMAYGAAKITKEGGVITDSDLQYELNRTVGEAKTTVETNEDGSLTVVFEETKNAYKVSNGKIEETEYIKYVEFEVTDSNYAMMGITSLEGDVVIPQTFVYDGVNYKVTSIAQEAFYDCTEITSITIPNGVKTIEEGAFAACEEITSIIIPNSVTFIGEYAFEGCYNLTDITLSNSLTSIENGLFCDCQSLTSIIIPDGVKTIGESAFAGCEELISVILPSSVETIESEAFYYCTGLTEIEIPSSVAEIASDAFDECDNIELIILEKLGTLEIPDDNWGAENAVIITKEETRADFFLFNEETGNIYLLAEDISESHDGIGYYYNDDDEKIISEEYVVIPSAINGVEVTGIMGEIPYNGKSTENYQAFPGSSNLKAIIIPDTVTSIDDCEFSGCTNLKYIKLSNKLTRIGSWTFGNCVNLKRIKIPESVTEIDYEAFNNCTSLTEITIPKSVTYISSYAFEGCTNLEKIIIEEGSTLEVPTDKWGATNATVVKE